MAIYKGFRFPIAFDDAFAQGLVMVGEVSPDNEFQSVTDPDETKAKRASFEITLLADVQPVPATSEVLPGMRPIELEGLTAEPKVAGQGEFKYQSYAFRATGFKAAGIGSGSKSARSTTSGEAAAKAA